jgi:hypothetical protein
MFNLASVKRMPDFSLIDDMVTREMICKDADVVYVKAVAMAHDGLCCMLSDGGGRLILAAPRGREAELDCLVKDFMEEFAARERTRSE